MGPSDREKGAERLNQDISQYGTGLESFNPTIKNRFDNIKLPNSYNDIRSSLSSLYDMEEGRLTSEANNDLNRAGRTAVGSLASRGITSGSVVDDTITKMKAPVLSSKYSAMQQLKQGKIGADIGLRENENKTFLSTEGMATDVDRANIMAQLQKSGLLQQLLGIKASNLQNMDDSTWLDDVLSAAGDLAPIIATIATGGAAAPTMLPGMLARGAK